MSTFSQSVDRLESAKSAIEQAIADRGVDVPAGTKLTGVPDLIRKIAGSGARTTTVSKTDRYGNITAETVTSGDVSLAGKFSDTDVGCKVLVECSPTAGENGLRGAFNGCKKLRSVDLPEGFCTSAKDVSNMFADTWGLDVVTFPVGFGTVVENAYDMFGGAGGVKKVVLPAGFGSKIRDAGFMFSNTYALEELAMPPGFGASIENASYMFMGCHACGSLEFPPGFGAAILNALGMFSSQNLADEWTLRLPHGFCGAATNMESMFKGCPTMKAVTLPDGFGAAAVSMRSMFSGCRKFDSVVFPTGFGAVATVMGGMFYGCSSLESVEFAAGAGAACLTFDTMFSGCSSLRSVRFSDVEPRFGSKARFASGMFEGCASLEDITGSFVVRPSLDLSDCPLTHDSLVNVIGNLNDRAQETDSYVIRNGGTLTLGPDNLVKLTDDEKAVATGKGWTLK